MWIVRRFWPLIAGAVLLVGAWLWHMSEVRSAHKAGYNKAQAEAASQREKDREHQREIDEEVQREHEARVGELQGRVNRLLARNDAIRMCEPGDVQAGTDTGEPTGSTAGGSALRAGADLQPRLVLYGQQCEKLRRQLIAIKQRQEMN